MTFKTLLFERPIKSPSNDLKEMLVTQVQGLCLQRTLNRENWGINGMVHS